VERKSACKIVRLFPYHATHAHQQARNRALSMPMFAA
jgi:hypothetical protein